MKFLVTGGSGFIGTNLVEKLIAKGAQIINVDTTAPYKKSHEKYWTKLSILDKDSLLEVFQKEQPEFVIHLAARTDTDPINKLEDYVVNTDGTNNLLEAIKSVNSVKHTIITSTQFVHQYKGFPKDDTDYAPHTIYGESKVISEKLTRSADLKCNWTIIRPTNIWGPWHLRYPYEFWKVLAQGLYIHPGKQKVMRSYGYVGNVVHQILTILEKSPELVHQQVFYVGDAPLNLLDWVNQFSINQIGKKVKVVPRFLIKTIALTGDVLKVVGLNFPITTSRYKSMTTSNDAPMQKTFDVLGNSPISLEMGVEETIEWLKEEHPSLIKVSETKNNS
ncbi:hypothetical protein BKI52_25880 [marine bacterium AO1-C]|nr:hypothetical protein BKI52_25880 [marine bacterium AO1-C]